MLRIILYFKLKKKNIFEKKKKLRHMINLIMK